MLWHKDLTSVYRGKETMLQSGIPSLYSLFIKEWHFLSICLLLSYHTHTPPLPSPMLWQTPPAACRASVPICSFGKFRGASMKWRRVSPQTLGNPPQHLTIHPALLWKPKQLRHSWGGFSTVCLLLPRLPDHDWKMPLIWKVFYTVAPGSHRIHEQSMSLLSFM